MTRYRLLGLIAIAIAIAAGVAIFSTAGRDGAGSQQVGESRPAPGDYAGRSSQGRLVKVTVAENRRTLTLEVRWRCESARDPAAVSVRLFRHRSVTIARDGTFSGTGSSIERPGGAVRETARFAGRTSASGKLRGTWSGEYAYVTDDTDTRCASGDVAFELRRRRSTPGTDATGNPVVALDGPREVAIGAGRAWVLEQGQGGPAVVRIDLATGAARARTPIGALNSSVAPPGIAFPPVLAAGEGAAWVVTGILGPRLEMTRVDGRTGRVRRIAVVPRAPGPGGVAPVFQSLAVGAGAVWMLVGDRVLRLDARSGRIVRSIRLTPAPPADVARHCGRGVGRGIGHGLQADRLAIGADAVWVASKCGPRPSRLGFLSRIDPRTNRVTRAVALRRSYSAIAAGPAGLWAAPATATGLTPRPPQPALHRLDPRDGRSIAMTPLPAGEVTGLGVGRAAVWVTQASERRAGAPVGALRRVDWPRGRLSTVLRLERPSSLAVGNRSVWIVDSFARTLRGAST
jgi:hypothetical protein